MLVFIVPIILRFFVKEGVRQDPEDEGTTEAAADLGTAFLAIPPPVDTSAQEDNVAAAAAENESVHSEISLPIHKTGTGMFSDSLRWGVEDLINRTPMYAGGNFHMPTLALFSGKCVFGELFVCCSGAGSAIQVPEQSSEPGYLENPSMATITKKNNPTDPAHIQTLAEAETQGPPEPKNGRSNQPEARNWYDGILPI